MTYFPVHVHSAFSVMDGMGEIENMANRVANLGFPAFALTDHGTMAGVVQGYKYAKKAGVLFYPGCEFYVVRDAYDDKTKGTRYHLGMVALDLTGYKVLTQLQTFSYQKDRYYYKPLVDLGDFAALAEAGLTEHVAVTTGCYGGIVIDEWKSGETGARNRIKMLQKWFPNLYVEVQNHHITWPDGSTDLSISESLMNIADELGLPVVAGEDSHYLNKSQQKVHDLMKDICYFGAGEDSHFKGGPYGISKNYLKNFPADWQDRINAGHQDLLDKHKLVIPALDTYKFRVPKMHANPNKVLAEQSRAVLKSMGLDKRKGYKQRLEEELKVIETMGFADYFLLVLEHVIDWCKINDVIVNTRGSANGSLVCFVLGITNVDPIKWTTSFDRFLSVDRKKPPDIDFDVDYRARDQLVAHLRAVFPTATQIGTYSRIGLNRTGTEDKGSVIVQYMAAHRKKDPNFDGKVKPEHRDALNDLADELVFKSLGVHPAGLVLPGDGQEIDDYIPLGRVISSDTTVTQYGMKDVELLGYVKVDILGLRVLQTVNGCLSRIGKKINEWDWIPLNDPKTMALLRSGNGTGVFQFEGFSTQHGAKEMKVASTMDVIICMALYRPALMNGGQKDLYLQNRSQQRGNQLRMHAMFDGVVRDTAGVPLFQEQIMEMLKAIGMEFEEYNDLMTAVKASNDNVAAAKETFARLMPRFYDLCEERGLDDDEADFAWNTIVGFTDYGFNRAHATSYGLMAYRSAYLKTHYPLEYMASLLDVWGDNSDKTNIYTAEARRVGISIGKATVNASAANWDIDPSRGNTLRKGLVSIDGIGDRTAQLIHAERVAHGPYTSVQDFIDRTPRQPVSGGSKWKKERVLIGVCKILQDHGAFAGLPDNDPE